MIELVLAATLTWTQPQFGCPGCKCSDSTHVLTEYSRWAVLRLKDQYPLYFPGIEALPERWIPLTIWCIPDTVAKGLAWPGQRCSISYISSGEYVVIAGNSKGWSCWSNIRRVP